jgi:hypothetical protein
MLSIAKFIRDNGIPGGKVAPRTRTDEASETAANARATAKERPRRRAPGDQINVSHSSGVIVAPRGPVTLVVQAAHDERPGVRASYRAKPWQDALIADIRRQAEALNMTEADVIAVAAKTLKRIVLRLECLSDDDLTRVWQAVVLLKRPAME